MTPSQTTTYAITATGSGGTKTASVTVTVLNPPTVSFSSASTTIQAGQSATLTWSAANADTVAIDQGIGNVATSGSTTVTPTQTTTYTITATGPGGTKTASVTVTVLNPPTVSFSSTSTTIQAGQSVALTWSAANADTVAIDQGIGNVATSGSVTVTPNQTTTYTITATGPGGTKTAAVTITVTHPVPTVSFSANPATVQAGQPTTLTWSSTNADTVSIDQGIGNVAISGSVSITPTQTTTFTITASGPGGSKTASATVTVTSLPPTVAISVSPTNLQSGQSAVLQWSSTNTDSVSIDQGVGNVAQNGSMTVSPAATTTYTITASGPGGTATAGATLTVAAMTLQITYPVDGDLVPGPEVMVRGVITRGTPKETAVLVNGVVADVIGNEFVANRVPLEDGQNEITVVATDVNGNSGSASIAVQRSAEGGYVELYADAYTGVAPFEATLKANASFNVTTLNFSYTGPGQVEFLEGSDPEERQVRISAGGTYQFTVEATDSQGEIHTATAGIVVQNRSQMDSLLKAKWNGMKNTLLAGAIEDAVAGYFLEYSKERYRVVFNALSSKLPGIVSEMQEIEMVKCRNRRAEYRIDRVHQIEGEPVTITYSVFFNVDTDGFWKIDQF